MREREVIPLPPLARRRFVALAAAGVSPLAVASCSGTRTFDMSAPHPTLPAIYSLSADGRLVTLTAGAKGICQFDWRTSQMGHIPLVPGFRTLGWPSYSYDGTKLVVVAELPRKGQDLPEVQIGIIDLATQEMASFPVGQYFSNPIFRPDGKAILYMGGGLARSRPYLFDLNTRTSRELLPSDDSFSFTPSTPSFIDNDTVFFMGRGPRNPELARTIETLGKSAMSATVPYNRASPVSTALPYVLRIGSKPEIAHLEFVKRQLSDRNAGLPELMPASRYGGRIAFLAPSQIDPARRSKLVTNLPRYDLFVMEHGQVRQVTRLENYMAYSAISQDGSTAAFGIYPGAVSDVPDLNRGKVPLELAIVDLDTGQVTRSDFVKRLYADAYK